jgi:hypothetical protein
MTTDAELDDWASDTWHSFAPITAVPVSVVYCALNLALAAFVRGVWHLIARLLGRRSITQPAPFGNDLPIPEDGNPYRPPRNA